MTTDAADIDAVAAEIRASYWLPPTRTASAVLKILANRGWQKRQAKPGRCRDIAEAVARLAARGEIGAGTSSKRAHALVLRELGIDPAQVPYGLQSCESVRKAMRAAGIGGAGNGIVIRPCAPASASTSSAGTNAQCGIEKTA